MKHCSSYWMPITAAAVLFFAVSCSSVPKQAAQLQEEEEALTPCDSSLTPIVFLHGMLASGDTYADQAMRFTSNGYCAEWLHAFDWNTLGGGGAAATAVRLDAFIDSLLARTGKAKVHLVGHSAGGGLGYAYLSDAARAAKVDRYVHLGSGAQPKPAGAAGDIPTLNLYSADDRVVPGGDIPGAENRKFTGLDHYQIATAPEVFAAMYAFFNGQEPGTTDIEAQGRIVLVGRVVSLGENAPQSGASIEIFELDTRSGRRLREQPDAALTADEDGRWGPWKAKPGVRYEFFVRTTNPMDRPVHYYREAFSRSNTLVYLRTLPGAGSPAGLLLAGLPRNDSQSVLAVFSASRAMVHGRDTLNANGTELTTEALTPAGRTVIAMFLYDGGDGKSSGAVHPAFQMMRTFLTGVDFFIPTAEPASVHLQFNGRSLYVPNWKTASEGVSVAVFD